MIKKGKKKKMPSEEERLERISKNFNKLPKKKRSNLKKTPRGGEIIKHAQGTMTGASGRKK